MKKITLLFLGLLGITSVLFIACDENDDNEPIIQNGDRVFITNEGPFMEGTGTLSVLYNEGEALVNEVFQRTNGYPLGNILQSMTIIDDKIFLIVNNANKIEVIDKDDYTHIATININLPRYLLQTSQTKAYVTSWTNYVMIADLTTFQVIDSIATGMGPEMLIKHNNKLFILNKGGFHTDSTITVIDCQTGTFLSTIQVADKPDGAVIDKNGKLWVLCSGKGWNYYPQEDDTEGHLICINPENYIIEKDLAFYSTHIHPEKLIINETGDVLYFNYPGGVFSQNISSDKLNFDPLIPYPSIYYNIAYDYDNDMIYCTDPGNYVERGWVYRYHASNGTVVDSFRVGIIPNGVSFD